MKKINEDEGIVTTENLSGDEIPDSFGYFSCFSNKKNKKKKRKIKKYMIKRLKK